MSALIAFLILVLLGLVVFVVGAPLRSACRREAAQRDGTAPVIEAQEILVTAAGLEHDELEAAREAKYREIRDAELDYRTGKLSPEDYAAIDAQLRAEALEILDRLEPGETAEEGGG